MAKVSSSRTRGSGGFRGAAEANTKSESGQGCPSTDVQAGSSRRGAGNAGARVGTLLETYLHVNA